LRVPKVHDLIHELVDEREVLPQGLLVQHADVVLAHLCTAVQDDGISCQSDSHCAPAGLLNLVVGADVEVAGGEA